MRRKTPPLKKSGGSKGFAPAVLCEEGRNFTGEGPEAQVGG